jgi:hypothetical protein
VRILWNSASQVTAPKKELSRFLDAEKPGVIADWYEGSHGVRNAVYPGEDGEYGVEMWEATYRLWESQSEYALKLLANESTGSLSKHPVVWHWERSVHLLTNRLFFGFYDEIYLTLRQADGYLARVGSDDPNPKVSAWANTLAQIVQHIEQQVVRTAKTVLNEITTKDFDGRFKPKH